MMKVVRHIAGSSEMLGFVLGLSALLAAPFQATMLWDPGWVLFSLALISSFAALARSVAVANDLADPRQAVKQGVASAGIASLAGVFCYVWLARRFPDTAFRAWLPGLLSILPAMFCGMLTAGIAVLTVASRPANAQASETPSLPAYLTWGVRICMGTLLLLALGVIDTFSEPVTVAEIKPQLPRPPPPAPDTFTVPKDMAHADATRWQLSKSRAIHGIASGLYAISYDDRWLATAMQDRHALRVLDLHTFDEGKTIRLSRPVDRISFDPAARRIVAVSDSEPAEFVVIDMQIGSIIRLPMPRKRAVPQGSLRWLREHEVLIGTSERDLHVLNLETLEVDAASDVSSWKETRITEQEKIVQGMAPGLRETARWKWEVSHAVRATELPEVEGTSEWPIGLGRCLAIAHPERDFGIAFATVAAEDGDLFSSSRDGAKVFRTRGNTLDIFYFTISPPPPLQWTLAMPHGIEKCVGAEETKRALQASKLCALVYAPLHNPLNGRVIGPDRSQVKAILTFDSWYGGKAECRISNLFSQIDSKDIVSDPCLWNGNATELLSLDTPHRWWAALPDPMPGSDAVTALPTRKSIDTKAALANKDEAERSTDIRLTPGLLSPSASPSLIPQAFALPQKSVGERIADFVTLHHQAARAGDVDRLLKNYAERVDHFNNGWVDRDFILRDELKYHAENAILEEKVVGNIRVAASGGTGSHAVIYLLQVSIQNLATRQVKNHVFEVSLDVTETADGFKIVRQKAVKQP